jgi:hypothetical protein
MPSTSGNNGAAVARIFTATSADASVEKATYDE